jgi:A/G-specific adenine glycosylase
MLNTKKTYPKLTDALVSWYKDHNSRTLPWRTGTPDPYKVWISEIMLQQTTSQAVIGYYSKFIALWPNVEKLSLATQEEVNEAWQGLGYYSRARNILKCAKIIVSDYDSVFPKSSKELLKLPGIGPYTSSAIASICYEEKCGVVDGNVLRVFNRLLGETVEWWKPDFHKRTQAFSNALCALEHKPSEVNQALMDLGATACTPKSPTCMFCPIEKFCASKKENLQKTLPIKKQVKAKEIWLYEVYKNKSDTTKVDRSNKNLKDNQSLSVCIHKNQPFLKKNLLPKGRFTRLNKPPKNFSFKHSITHNSIFVDFVAPATKQKSLKESVDRSRIMTLKELGRVTPSSLIKKIWQSDEFHETI